MKNYGFAGVNYVPGFGFIEDPIRKALGPSDRASAFSGDTDVMMISGLGQAAPGASIPTAAASSPDIKTLALYAFALLGAWTALQWVLAKMR